MAAPQSNPKLHLIWEGNSLPGLQRWCTAHHTQNQKVPDNSHTIHLQGVGIVLDLESLSISIYPHTLHTLSSKHPLEAKQFDLFDTLASSLSEGSNNFDWGVGRLKSLTTWDRWLDKVHLWACRPLDQGHYLHRRLWTQHRIRSSH